MSGLMNSYFYGKAGQADFTPDQLPKNRLELFFTVLRGQLGKLVQLNLLYDLFCLPLIVWVGLNFMVLTNSLESDPSFSVIGSGLFSTFLLGLIPCMLVMGLGSAGQIYPLRNWARDQHSFMLSDFKDSFKENWKKGLVLGLINGLSLPMVYIGSVFYGSQASSNLFFVVPQVFVIVAGTVWWMMNMVSFPMVISYDMKLSQIIRNSLLIAVARLPWSVLFLALTTLVPMALAVFVPYAALVLVLYYLLIGFSVNGLIYASYANSCFDHYLNPRIEGAKVGQGLRDPALDYLDEAEEEEVRREADSLK